MTTPPLPEPWGESLYDARNFRITPALYTAAQMHAYTAQCVAAERERCAGIVQDIDTNETDEIAAAIRKEPTP